MPVSVFEEMKQYVGFDGSDAQRLRALGPSVAPYFPRIVERFYSEILRHPGAAQVFSGSEQMKRLQASLLEWLASLFCGDYDDRYCRHRSEIGRVHVRVYLPQHYMFAAMELIWQELRRAALESGAPDNEAGLASLHKLVMLELGVMLETYKSRYSEVVRQNERDAVHERLTRAEHLAQIGQLAASLAHEIKNPLAGISGAMQVMRDSTTLDDPRRRVMLEILRQIGRLDGTVKDLLEYARPRLPKLERCDLGRVAERVARLLGEEPETQGIRIEYLGEGGCPIVLADENQMEQLLLNLVINAAHASTEGGTVRIRTSASSHQVRLDVEDSGHGMSSEVCRKAFEPFFTTKARGTGLGLSICQKIVEAHNGAFTIRSTEGEGTTVSVRLPRGRSQSVGEH